MLGRTIEVFGRDYTIIGVAPAGFTGIDLAKVDIWLPLEASFSATNPGRLRRTGSPGSVVIRLKDGVSIEAAEAEATRLVLNGWRGVPAGRGNPVRLALWPLIAAQGPNANFDPGRGLEAAAESRVAVWLVGVSVIVLLIACANVANLLLARGVSACE